MKLIIINGPCGVGKSTIAKKLHESMPLSFLFDIDAQMRFISHYRENPEARKKATLALADAITNAMLDLNHDIIIDKMIFHEEILNSCYELADKHSADIYEIILWASKETVMKRANDRGWRKDGLLTPEKCELFWDKINELKDKRSQATIIDTESKSEEDVFNEVKSIVD